MKLKTIITAMCVLFAAHVFAAAPALENCETKDVRTGAKSSKEIARLHGKEIDFESSYVAEYQCGADSVIVWASFSKTLEEANMLYDQMDKKMPESRTFKNIKRIDSDGYNVTFVTGMGMDNYYFVDGKGNYWIATAGENTLSTLNKFTKTLK